MQFIERALRQGSLGVLLHGPEQQGLQCRSGKNRGAHPFFRAEIRPCGANSVLNSKANVWIGYKGNPRGLRLPSAATSSSSHRAEASLDLGRAAHVAASTDPTGSAL